MCDLLSGLVMNFSLPYVFHVPSISSAVIWLSNIWRGVQIIKLLIICSFIKISFASSLLGSIIIVCTLFSDTVSFHCSISMAHQFSHCVEATLTLNYSVSIERFVVSIILRAVTVLHTYVNFCLIFFLLLYCPRTHGFFEFAKEQKSFLRFPSEEASLFLLDVPDGTILSLLILAKCYPVWVPISVLSGDALCSGTDTKILISLNFVIIIDR
jgi:hypothetical protein